MLDSNERERAVTAILAEALERDSRREKKPVEKVKGLSHEDYARLSDIKYEKLYKEDDLL